MFAYVNGTLVDETVAGVPIFDHGFIVGDGVFETIALRHGEAIAVTRHLARLTRSAAGLGLPPPRLDQLHEAVGHTVAANPGVEWGALRVTYTSGSGGIGSSRGAIDETTLVVAPREIPRATAATDVITVPWPRNERGALVGLKTTSYAENAKAVAEAQRRGATEAIFANTAGNLCEGSGTNVFLAIDGVLVTPPLSAGCLAGVTRGLLLEKCSLGAEERDVPLEALLSASEAFLTSATRDVQAIRAVDGHALAACPGPLTAAAARAYAQLLVADPDPA